MLTCLASLFSTENRSSDFVLVLPQLFTTQTKKSTQLCLFHLLLLFPSLRRCRGQKDVAWDFLLVYGPAPAVFQTTNCLMFFQLSL